MDIFCETANTIVPKTLNIKRIETSRERPFHFFLLCDVSFIGNPHSRAPARALANNLIERALALNKCQLLIERDILFIPLYYFLPFSVNRCCAERRPNAPRQQPQRREKTPAFDCRGLFVPVIRNSARRTSSNRDSLRSTRPPYPSPGTSGFISDARGFLSPSLGRKETRPPFRITSAARGVLEYILSLIEYSLPSSPEI